MIREAAFALGLLLAQACTGTDPVFAAAMSLAVLAGLCSVRVAGGWTSLAGLINAALLMRFLLFGLLVKLAALDRTDAPLMAPLDTSLVCLLGFTGVHIGSAIVRIFPTRRPLIPAVTDSRDYMSLYLMVVALGFGGWLYTYVGRQHMMGMDNDAVAEEAVGGLYGVLGFFATIKHFAIACAIYHVHYSGSKRLLTNPLVIGTLVMSLLAGTYSTSKREMMEPLLFLAVPMLQLKGPLYRPFWLLVLGGTAVFALVVYPYSQYVRFTGGRSGSTFERVEKMVDTLGRLAVDPTFRVDAEETVIERHDPYLPVAQRQLFRFSLFIEADRLIHASLGGTTGWETIVWGFEMVPPRFLYPAKPRLPANNYLGHIAGDVWVRDFFTQISYGFMANLFNAFGFLGVFFGSIAVMAGLHAWILLFFGRPGQTSIWVALVLGHYHHPLTEQAVSGLIADVWWPVIVLIVVQFTRPLRPFLDRRGSRERHAR